MIRRVLYFVLYLLIITDLAYSFKQHASQTLDGDMAGGIVPANNVKPIFESPLGTDVILKSETYPNPNRYFSHLVFKEYFCFTPIWLQKFTSSIESIYLSCAISKIIIQFFIILFLAIAITGTKNILKLDFLLAIILVTPLFQTNGYRGYMGIIDPSTTYTFFYALPAAILMLYLLPFIEQFHHLESPSKSLLIKIIWIPLSFVACLSGPLNPGIVLIFFALVILTNFKNNYYQSTRTGIVTRTVDAIKSIPKGYLFYLIPISILSIYSLFIGKYNSISIINQVPLGELYLKIPAGIYFQFTQKLGFPVLFLILTINSIIISKHYKTTEGVRLLKIFKWVGIFSLVYILLLPLGGYRNYRPNVLRYDTIMPITLSLMFIFGATSLYLIKQMKTKQKAWYIPLIVCVLLIFTYADKPEFSKNLCEKSALIEISESKENIVQLQGDCNVISWNKIVKPEDSELNAQLLVLWRVTKEKKLYINK